MVAFIGFTIASLLLGPSVMFDFPQKGIIAKIMIIAAFPIIGLS